MKAVIRSEEEMKDSGVPWINEVPKEWRIVRLKYTSTLKGRIGWQGLRTDEYQESGPYLITGTDFDNGVINWDTCAHISEERFEMDTNIQIIEDDLLITKDGTIGKVAIAKNCPSKVSLNSGVFICRNDKNVICNSKFLYYVVNSEQFKLWYELNQHGNSTIKHLTQERFYNFEFAYPSCDEQQLIADFLDEKCSKIDEIIVEAKASIDEYKELKQSAIDNATMTGIHNSEMKDTDYIWFPEMPKHWNLALASLLFREDVRPVDENDVSLSLSQVDGLIPTDDMSERSLKSATHDNWKHVIPDDLVLNRFKGHLGVFFASRYTGMVSFHYGVYHAIRDDVYAKYYEYLFHSTTYKNIFALKSNGITVGLQNLSNGNFYSVKILHPPLDEQKEIVNYLDEKCKQIDSLISEKESLIHDLEEYKKALIYEVVTGKRRVV